MLAAFEKHAHRVLRRGVAVADALLRETELSSSAPTRPAPAREPWSAACPAAARVLLPAAHRGLAAMLAVEDDVAAAGGEAFEKHAPREGTEPTRLFPTKVPDEETLFEEEEKPKTSFGSEDSSSRVVVAARVAEAHIAGKGASAYAVYAVRVRARTRASGDKETETETEWVVPRRFRNFEALHRRCERSERDRETIGFGSFDAARASASASDSPPTVSDTTPSSDTRARKKLAFAPCLLPKKRSRSTRWTARSWRPARGAGPVPVALVSCPARAGGGSAATDAFLDPATVDGPFAPDPDRNAFGDAFGAFASHHKRLSASATGVAETVAGGARGRRGERPESADDVSVPSRRAPSRRRPPAVPLAESSSTSAVGTNTDSERSERTPRESRPSHRRAASSARSAFRRRGSAAAADGTPKERAAAAAALFS